MRRALDESREAVRLGSAAPSLDEIAREVVEYAGGKWHAGPSRVINATGVVLHTNLGRAPLSEGALAAIGAAAGYTDLEYDVDLARRGSRQSHTEALLVALTGAEAVHVVVNNAAAVLLALAALASRKQVLVSRGQAVEIGGGFRIPEIMRQSGARLVDVGTSNRTRLQDFEAAISARTAGILHVHASNFRVVGFTEEVALADLSRLAKERNLVLLDDNGSGSLLDTERFGLRHEPTPIESLEAGADVVAFSADKLLGGPQAGVLAGKASCIARIARHPLARAFRPDKLVLAALSATLVAYLRGCATEEIPVWRMIDESADDVGRRAESVRREAHRRGLRADLQPGESTIGGGSLPGETLPTTLVTLPDGPSARALRAGNPPVIAREKGEQALLDLRTVLPEDDAFLLRTVLDMASSEID